MSGIIVNEELIFNLTSKYAREYGEIPKTNKQAVQFAYEQAQRDFAEDLKPKTKDVINNTTGMECGITECCGYDFGIDGFGKVKVKYCPLCGKKIIKVS